jgi:hypothetical protein
MPRIVTAVHDPAALAATCRKLGLPPPREGAVRLAGEEVFGRVVRLPGLHGPLVFDTLTGLVAYHPADNAHDRYARIMRLLRRYYDVRAARRRDGPSPVLNPPGRTGITGYHHAVRRPGGHP